MNFLDYTYKADVENEKCMIVNVIKELVSIQTDNQQPQETPKRIG